MHHKRAEGVESDGVGWLNLHVNQDKRRADKFSQRVRTDKTKTKNEEQEEKEEGSG